MDKLDIMVEPTVVGRHRQLHPGLHFLDLGDELLPESSVKAGLPLQNGMLNRARHFITAPLSSQLSIRKKGFQDDEKNKDFRLMRIT